MKAVRWYAPRDMRLVEVEKPVPQAHEALIRIESVGVCGSDMHYYKEGRIGSQILTTPLILGHEYAGIVEAVGEHADASLVGKRVAVEPGIPCMQCEWCKTGHYNVCTNMFFPGGPGCDGALCEYMTVHADFCFPVPDAMTAQEAAMIEPVAVALHTVELAKITPGETVAVLGSGPVGLLVLQLVRLSGAQTLYASDVLRYRVEAALRYGADCGIHAAEEDIVARIMQETQGRGVDVAIDCTNASEGMGLAARITRPAGRCVLTGISGQDEDPLPVSVVRRRELNLQWCRRFRHNFPAALALTASGKIDVTSMITHSFPLEETVQAFELVAENKDEVLKASIDR